MMKQTSCLLRSALSNDDEGSIDKDVQTKKSVIVFREEVRALRSSCHDRNLYHIEMIRENLDRILVVSYFCFVYKISLQHWSMSLTLRDTDFMYRIIWNDWISIDDVRSDFYDIHH